MQINKLGGLGGQLQSQGGQIVDHHPNARIIEEVSPGAPQAAVPSTPTGLQIPKLENITVNNGQTNPGQQTTGGAQVSLNNNVMQTKVSQTIVGQEKTNGVAAKFSPNAAVPMTPERPNTLSGQVMGPEMDIIEGAILEIQDKNGVPVRAVKTNKAGHFLTVTPMDDGEYTIITEKDGFDFEPVKVVASGAIIEPIAIKAKKKNI